MSDCRSRQQILGFRTGLPWMKFPAGNGCWMTPSTQITVTLVPVSIQQLEAADEDPVEFIIRPGSGVSMDSYGFYGWGIYS